MSYKNPHILLVDDNQDYQNVVRHALEKDGFEVKIAGNGQQGWHELQQFSSEIELIILDMVMPNTDGLWLIEKLKNSSNFSKLPIIILTNLNHGEKIGKAVIKGVSRLLNKETSSFKEISMTVREVIRSNS